MKGDRLMNNSIIFLDTPFETKEADWLFENTGRISVALDTHKNGIVKIIAYSDNVSDKKELFALAKKKHGHIIRNISDRGVDYIDENISVIYSNKAVLYNN